MGDVPENINFQELQGWAQKCAGFSFLFLSELFVVASFSRDAGGTPALPGKEEGKVPDTGKMPGYRNCYREKAVAFSFSANSLAARYSRFILAMLTTVISLGHSASQA